MPLQYLKIEVRDEVDFLYADKHQSFLQVDFNILGIILGNISSLLQRGTIIIDGHDQAFSKYSK